MSSNDIAVSVRGLGKSYAISHDRAAKATTAAEAIMNRIRNPFQKSSDKETFWALTDVSFDVERGDVVGIIGRNGAGKSTLLKVLSRITEPTKGEAILNGRVGSLLEVGTGFHPELTGRENIYLNGAILGMRKSEIDRQFDAIVDFSGTEKFLDTPVKRYSSGMYVRLAFAVAAHLNPEILIVDEVLAVGDAEFQKKCMGKMQDVANGGRTVLFVSHNEAAVRRMCKRAILLRNGEVDTIGTPEEAFAKYRMKHDSSTFNAGNRTKSSPYMKIVDATLSVDGIPTNELFTGAKPVLQLIVEVSNQINFSPEILIRDENSLPVLFCPIGLALGKKYSLPVGTHELTYQLDLPYLASGAYWVDLILTEPCIRFFDYIEEAIGFTVSVSTFKKSSWIFDQSTSQGCIVFEISDKITEVNTFLE
jgi:lipopolysaccharide transport system ATP-binding protein